MVNIFQKLIVLSHSHVLQVGINRESWAFLENRQFEFYNDNVSRDIINMKYKNMRGPKASSHIIICDIQYFTINIKLHFWNYRFGKYSHNHDVRCLVTHDCITINFQSSSRKNGEIFLHNQNLHKFQVATVHCTVFWKYKKNLKKYVTLSHCWNFLSCWKLLYCIVPSLCSKQTKTIKTTILCTLCVKIFQVKISGRF